MYSPCCYTGLSTALRPRRPRTTPPEGAAPMVNTRPYDPAFANRIVELASGGLFRNEIAQALGANDDDFDAWSSQHPEFAGSARRRLAPPPVRGAGPPTAQKDERTTSVFTVWFDALPAKVDGQQHSAEGGPSPRKPTGQACRAAHRPSPLRKSRWTNQGRRPDGQRESRRGRRGLRRRLKAPSSGRSEGRSGGSSSPRPTSPSTAAPRAAERHGRSSWKR